MLGLGCKLITTNKAIMREDFYHPNSILIIDFEKSNWLDEINRFKKLKYVDLDMKNYSLSCWLKNILDD